MKHTKVSTFKVKMRINNMAEIFLCEFVLQLFGGLVPRIIGQKKVRDDEAMKSLMTVNEFFARYPDLRDYLLAQLSTASDSHQLVNPSTVPLLTMMSQLTAAAASTSDDQADVSNTLAAFKSSFEALFHCPVINVRVLAVKAYLAFTATQQEADEVVQWAAREIVEKKCSTNQLHALFTLIHLATKGGGVSTKNQLDKVVQNFNHPRMLIKRLQLEIHRQIHSESALFEPNLPPDSRVVHPGQKDLMLELTQDKLNTDKLGSKAEVIRVLNYVKQDFTGQTVKKCAEILRLNFVNGAIVATCNQILHKCSDVILADPELAMDLLEATQILLTSKNVGLTAKTTTLITQAQCFASMMVQDDFDMFFGDGSFYTAQFSELTHHLEDLSGPEGNSETSRLHVAAALAQLLPVFRKRSLKTDFHILVVLAFTQAFNACLVLLEDEEREVRLKATAFASQLQDATTASCRPFPKNISTFHAVDKITLFGLENFSECLEWFRPVVDLFFKPWNGAVGKAVGPFDPIEYLERVASGRHQLFESGEGLNVFADEVAINNKYAGIIGAWLTKAEVPKINVNTDAVKTQVGSIFHRFNMPLGFDSPLRTPKGRLVLTRYRNLVKVMTQDDTMFGPPDPDLIELRCRLESMLV